mmetsp:Transcript_13307/g.32655  ORF Transcript_13307/g.32655 Transcript_13307/m.32655 type:complete len:239 (+) Transcript_13307:311-1027(+)
MSNNRALYHFLPILEVGVIRTDDLSIGDPADEHEPVFAKSKIKSRSVVTHWSSVFFVAAFAGIQTAVSPGPRPPIPLCPSVSSSVFLVFRLRIWKGDHRGLEKFVFRSHFPQGGRCHNLGKKILNSLSSDLLSPLPSNSGSRVTIFAPFNEPAPLQHPFLSVHTMRSVKRYTTTSISYPASAIASILPRVTLLLAGSASRPPVPGGTYNRSSDSRTIRRDDISSGTGSPEMVSCSVCK